MVNIMNTIVKLLPTCSMGCFDPNIVLLFVSSTWLPSFLAKEAMASLCGVFIRLYPSLQKLASCISVVVRHGLKNVFSKKSIH